MKRVLIALTCFALAAVMPLSSAVAGNLVKVWGSTTCQKRFLEPGAEALKNATGIEVKVLGVGSGKGLMALVQGKAVVSAASEDLEGAVKSALKTAKKAGKEITIPANLQFHEIAKDVIVPIVHKSNPLDSLSWAQLADLNTGKVTNWKDVGGPDLPVQVVTSHAGSATRAVFNKMVMKKEPYAANHIEVKSTRLEINEVSKVPGGVGAVSEGFFAANPGDAKVIKTDTISRPLALITVGDPTPEVLCKFRYGVKG